jgi:hypothetical protein
MRFAGMKHVRMGGDAYKDFGGNLNESEKVGETNVDGKIIIIIIIIIWVFINFDVVLLT